MATARKTEQSAITTTINAEILTLQFANGETMTLSADQLTPEIRLAAVMHGLKQKLVDAAAISRNPDTGLAATVADKYTAVREVYDRLLAGEWNKRRGDGSGTGSAGLLFRALAHLYPTKTEAELRAFLDGKDKAAQAALRANPKVAAIIEAIKAEQVKNAGDDNSDDLLAELG